MEVGDVLLFSVVGVTTGAIYAIGAAGLVLTYTTTGVFNFAHGAVGMMAAFAYWFLRVDVGLPTVAAVVLTLVVLAPALALLVELLMRHFRDADATTTLVVTIALTVAAIGIVQKAFPPQVRSLPALVADTGPRVFGVVVTWDQIVILLVAATVAVALRVLLYRTRIGIAMRAVVDNPVLAGLNGARPALLSRVAWVLGFELAAVAGILIGPAVGLEAITLTFLVVNAYAAAMAGRLRSLPVAFAGAIGLGLVQGYYDLAVLQFELGGFFQRVKPAIPTLFLLVFLLVLPAARLSSGNLERGRAPRTPSRQWSLVSALALVIGVAALAATLPERFVPDLSRALSNGVVMLSLVLLTGYGGLLSLSPLLFAGLGAWTMAIVGGGSTVGLLASALVAAPFGALVALPSARLKGLYLALSTFAIGVLANALVFQDPRFFGNGNRDVARPDVLGLSTRGDEAFTVFVAVLFAAIGIALTALRRSRYGRRLAAARDSEAAVATLGLDVRGQKVLTFTVSAAIAGVGGALLGAHRSTFGGIDVEVFNNLPLVLLAVVGGVTTVSGALIGGILLALLPLVQSEFEALGGVVFALIGGTAIALGRQPHGLVGLASSRWSRFTERLARPPVDPLVETPRPSEMAAGGRA